MPSRRKTEADLAVQRTYNSIYNARIYRPDGKVPKELIHRIRVRCYKQGGDLSVARDVRMAIHSLWEEVEEFSVDWQWLHPEESVITANRLSASWRRSTRKFRDKAFALILVECS